MSDTRGDPRPAQKRQVCGENRRDAPQNAPSCGISCAREITRIWSSVRMSGERPPCTQRTEPSMIYMYTHAPKQRTARRIGIGEKRGWTHGGEVEVVEDTAARLPDRCAAVLLLALLCER